MKKINIGNSGLLASEIALGCMRICGLEHKKIVELIETATDCGINFYDHADIYGGGKSEEMFAHALSDSSVKREDIIIQSKCGIRGGYYDFSKEHILSSVDGILKRLNTDYIDVLLLHRPDTLMEPEEVAQAFAILKTAGKVRNFGVSNQNSMQMQLLQKYVPYKLIANQLQFGPAFTGMVDSGITVNMKVDNSINRDGSILEYCRLNDITIQPWSPFLYGFFEGVFLESDKYSELNNKLKEVAEKHNTTESVIAVAWILRHPAKMQPIVGTTNSKRLKEITAASGIVLSRPEWYDIYRCAGNMIP